MLSDTNLLGKVTVEITPVQTSFIKNGYVYSYIMITLMGNDLL